MDTPLDRPREDRLDELLREWRDVAPPANFEAAVWRRIRADQAPAPFGVRLVRALREAVLPQPAWVTAMAATLAILLGVWAALPVPAGPDRHQAADPLLHSGTLAGSYLAMATGATR